MMAKIRNPRLHKVSDVMTSLLSAATTTSCEIEIMCQSMCLSMCLLICKALPKTTVDSVTVFCVSRFNAGVAYIAQTFGVYNSVYHNVIFSEATDF